MYGAAGGGELVQRLEVRDRVRARGSILGGLNSERVSMKTAFRTVLGGIDLQILGIGDNGHIGFNEPSSSFSSRTRVAPLAERTRQANARFFDYDLERVPRRCIMQGIATVLAARSVVLVAQGESKASAVAAAIEGPVSTVCPASALQLHDRATFVLDEAAASGLPIRV